MRIIDKHTPLVDACKMIKYAAEQGMWNGWMETMAHPYFQSCRWQLDRYPATLIFTREYGYHSSGWWKNPDYEYCWHLSLAFYSGSEKKVRDEILVRLFGEHVRWLWVEPPYTPYGKSKGVWHYRLFVNEFWQPIKPRGEVYDRHFTEKGWKSFSELNKR